MKKISIKSFLPRTLFGRSMMILVTPVVLIQIVATFVFFDRHWAKMTTRLAYSVSGEVAVFVKAYDYPAAQRQALIENALKHLNMEVGFTEGASLPAQQERFLPHFWESFVSTKLVRELGAQISQPFVVIMGFDEKLVDIYVQLDKGVLKIQLPQRRLFSSSGYIFLLWLLSISLVLLFIAIIFMRNQIRPIRKLAAASELFGKGRDAVSFKPEGAREVRQAGQAFMDMRRRIKRQVEQRTSTLAGVSHDLRTPLTRLKLQLAMMEQTADTNAMSDDIELMEKMIAGYLDFVRGEDGETVQVIDIEAIINKLTQSMSSDEFQIHTDVQNKLLFEGRPLAFERCVGNLIKNAGKYAQNLWIRIEQDDNRLKLTLDDDGPGIPEELREEVFKPFYREDSSRNIESGSVGLGLTIAMDIVHRHGGSIVLEDSDKGGLRILIRLPL